MMNLDKTLSAAALPVHEIVYQDLRALILFGEFIPGEAGDHTRVGHAAFRGSHARARSDQKADR